MPKEDTGRSDKTSSRKSASLDSNARRNESPTANKNLVRAGDIGWGALGVVGGALEVRFGSGNMKMLGVVQISKGVQSVVFNGFAIGSSLYGREDLAEGFDAVEDFTSFTGQATVLAYAIGTSVSTKFKNSVSLNGLMSLTEAIEQRWWGAVKLQMSGGSRDQPATPPAAPPARGGSNQSRGSGKGGDRDSDRSGRPERPPREAKESPTKPDRGREPANLPDRAPKQDKPGRKEPNDRHPPVQVPRLG